MKFPERELFVSKSPRDPVGKHEKMTLYKIITRTSSVKHAGTDANVYCHIFGEDFETGSYFKRDSFEKSCLIHLTTFSKENFF